MSYRSWFKKKKAQVKALFQKPAPAPQKAAHPTPPEAPKVNFSSNAQVGKASALAPPKASRQVELAQKVETARAFKKATEKKLGPQKVGQAVNRCVPGRRKGTPCDVQLMVIREEEVRTHHEWSKAKPGQKRAATFARPGVAKAGHLKSGQVFQVVAGAASGPTKKILKVSIRTDIAYCGEYGHPRLTIGPMSMPKTVHSTCTKETDVPVFRRDRFYDDNDSTMFRSLLSTFWFADHTPNLFTITASACGRRPTGLITRQLVANVEVYPDDQYSLIIKLPAAKEIDRSRGRNLGYQSGRGAYNEDFNKQRFVDSEGLTRRTDKDGDRRANGDAKRSQKTSGRTPASALIGMRPTIPGRPARGDRDPNVKIELRRNGQEDESVARISEIVAFVVNFKDRIQKIIDTVKEFKFDIGWSLDWECSAFEGQLVGEWGWQEHSDHRAFFGYAIKVELVFLELSVSLRFGISIKLVGLQATAQLSGTISARYTISGGVERTSPDSKWPDAADLLKITGECGVDLTAQLVIGRPEFFELEGKVESGVVVEGGLRVTMVDGMFIQYGVMWTGITATTRHRRFGFGKLTVKRYELCEEQDLFFF